MREQALTCRANDRHRITTVLTDVGLGGAVVIVTGAGSGIGAATAGRLLSPLASFMTGAVIPLDGGQVIDRE
jgi:NAD(P)-dependent dehydrogenase (short-subunit alcohol dehydrogenase family)